MKQILVAKTSDLESSGKKIVFKVNKDNLSSKAIPKDKLTIIEFPLSMKVLQGDGEFDLVFTLPEELALSGVVLLGAYLSNNKVKAAFIAVGGTGLYVEEGSTVLEARLVQIVSYKQINEGIPTNGTVMIFGGDGVKIEKSKPKTKNKK